MQAIKPAYCHMVNPCFDANQAIIRIPDGVVDYSFRIYG